jgi:hypothetical protein
MDDHSFHHSLSKLHPDKKLLASLIRCYLSYAIENDRDDHMLGKENVLDILIPYFGDDQYAKNEFGLIQYLDAYWQS